MNKVSYFVMSKSGSTFHYTNVDLPRYLPNKDFIIKCIQDDKGMQMNLELIDENGKFYTLKVKNITLIRIIRKVTYEWSYELYDQNSEKYLKFIVGKERSFPNFNIFINEIFPKIAELTNDQDYLPYLFNKKYKEAEVKIEKLESTIEKLKEQIVGKSS